MFKEILSYLLNILKIDNVENRYKTGNDVLPDYHDSELPLGLHSRGDLYSSKKLSKEK